MSGVSPSLNHDSSRSFSGSNLISFSLLKFFSKDDIKDDIKDGIKFNLNDRSHKKKPFLVSFQSLWPKVFVLLAIVLWLGIFHFNTIMIVGALVMLPHPVAVAVLIIYLSLVLIPIDEYAYFGRVLAKFIAQHAPSYFPIKVLYEDVNALDPKRAHVIAVEPHSVLPIGAIAFTAETGLTPFSNIRTLASSTLLKVPIARHVLSWLGMAAVSKESFTKILNSGTSCVIIPGGVQECLYMNSHQEVLFLMKRKGFVRMAMISGAPLVPVFIFGQRDVFSFWFPRKEWFYKLSRKMQFAPLCYWGIFGSPFPYPRPMTVVIGKPIEVLKTDTPNEKEVELVHAKFLEAMRALYEKHKGAVGASDIELVIM